MMAVHKNAAAKKPTTRRKKNGPVTTVTPIPEAWLAALALAGNDAKRCEVINERTIIVRNGPKS